MANQQTLISLAILKVNQDAAGKDYLDIVLPFVASVAVDSTDRLVTPQSIAPELLARFGLRIPHHTIALILRRLARRSHLCASDGAYTVSSSISAVAVPLEISQDTTERYALLIKSLAEFVNSRFGESWNNNHAAEALLSFLIPYQIECLTDFSGIPFSVTDGVVHSDAEFMVSSFVQSLVTTGSVYLDTVVDLVRGAILANVFLCSDLDKLPSKLSDVSFYLDTPLVLDFIGATGEYSQNVARVWVSLVAKLKGTVAVFSHILYEAESVLEACERNFSRPPPHDRIVAAFRRQNRGPSDVAVLRARTGAVLADTGVQIVDAPRVKGEFQIDEQALVGALDTQMHYWNQKAIETDAKSVAAIYQLREGKRPRHLEDGIAFLVTSNARLAAASRSFAASSEDADEVSPVITDYALANAAWLKSPMEAPDLPFLELMAHCLALMRPPDSLWAEYLAEIDNLGEAGSVSEGDIAVLRFSLEAQDELMNLTRGSGSRLFPATIDEVLRRAKARIGREEVEKTRAEQARADGLQHEVDELRSEADQKQARIRQLSRRWSNCLSISIMALLGIGLIIATIFAALGPTGTSGTAFLLWGITTSVCVVWAVVSLVTGTSLIALHRRLAALLDHGILHLLLRLDGER